MTMNTERIGMIKQTFKDALIELLKQNILIQGSISLALVLVVCYLYLNQMTVPKELLSIMSVILGFYFGSKFKQNLS